MALVLTNTSILLRSTPLLNGFSLAVESGAVTSIMGSSGCGKSTLLSWIIGSLDAAFVASGEIRLEGRVINGVAPHKRRIGILFQDDLLFPHMSVRQNMMFALPSGLSRFERRKAIKDALDSVELPHTIDLKSHELSGGQRARIALVRMLLSRPRAILLDEPFNKLDHDLKLRIREIVFGHIENMQVPALMVTHDINDAKAARGRIITFPEPSALVSEGLSSQKKQPSIGY